MKKQSSLKGVTYKDGIYGLDYRFNGRRIREQVGTSKMLAESAMSKIRTQIAENKYLDVRKKKKVKFCDFADEYLILHAQKFKSYKVSGLNNVTQLVRYFGGKYLHEITIKDVEGFKTQRLKEVTPATVNRQLSCLKSMFNRAIEWDMFDGKNPVCKVQFSKENNKRVEYLTDAEIQKMIEVCDDYFRPILITAINTGMRRGEILSLKWTDVNFHTDIIYIREAKSGEGRAIPMNNNVKNALMGVRKNPKSEYIFNSRKNEKRNDLRKPFARALLRAGITRHFRFHDLRHTFASHLAMKGVDLNTIRSLLGHSSLEMTMRYSHLSPDHNKRAVAVLDSKDILRNSENFQKINCN